MLGRKQEFNLKLHELLDSALLALAGWLAHTLRTYCTKAFGWVPIPELPAFYWLMAIIVPFTPLILEMLGYYKHPLQKPPFRSLTQLFQASLWLALFIGLWSIFAKFPVEARSFLPIYGVIGAAFLLLKEKVLQVVLRRRIREGKLRERVILVGPEEDTEKFLESLAEEQRLELDIVDRIDISVRPTEDLVAALHQHNVERVLFATAHVHFNRIEEAIAACELEGVEAWLWSGFIQTAIARPTFDAMGGKPMLVFRSTPDVTWALALKWLMDKVGAFVGLVILLPIWALIWIGIKFSSPGAPAIFKQRRSGKYGQPFTMYKFRTMIPDAEAKRQQLMDQNQMSGPVFKVDRDPRIFPFGRFLRYTSLDETPQLWNVLRGEMSLVGPRPLPTYETENFSSTAQRRRLSVKPGLTCLWQVTGRNSITDFDQWAALDLRYIDNWSIWLDIKILLMTIPAVVMGKGAK